MAVDPDAPPATSFEVVRRGYDQAQVEAHLRRLDADTRILSADRDAALDQAEQLSRELDDSRARADRLRAQVRTLVSPQQSVQGMSERMRSMLRLAEDEVVEMVNGAEIAANKRVREAEQRAEQILADARNQVAALQLAARADMETAERDRAKVHAELEATRVAHAQAIAEAEAAADRERARLDATQAAEHRVATDALATATAENEQARARAWADSEARRAMVEEDFTIAMDQRRKEALNALVTEQETGRQRVETMRRSAAADAHAMVGRARAESEQILAEARGRVGELVALRDRLIEQLGGVRAALNSTIDGLAPVAGEAPAPAAPTRAAPTPAAPPTPTAPANGSARSGSAATTNTATMNTAPAAGPTRESATPAGPGPATVRTPSPTRRDRAPARR